MSSPCTAAGLLQALDALRVSITQHGGKLLLRQGPLAMTLLQLVADTGATHIITEEEVEYRWVMKVFSTRNLLS